MTTQKKIEPPPCSTWNIWLGTEIEGNTDIGVQTLFIRSVPSNSTPESNFSFMTRGGKVKRVWFCKEFTNWKVLAAIARHFEKVCIEVNPSRFASIPADLRASSTIYLKVPLGGTLRLKPGDFVCVGPAFSDESFQIGQGVVVGPELYLSDIKLA